MAGGTSPGSWKGFAFGDFIWIRVYIVIAGGARPVPLAFPDAEHAITSDAFMELEDLPKRIVMVGGGYIAAEFSHIAARAGAKVTVLQRAERMLTRFDPELVDRAR
jgi:glutathione reductase (NADPH)